MAFTMKAGTRWAPGVEVSAAIAALSLGACMLTGESRIAQGQLYTSGNPTYDAFFRDVHQQQVDEGTWHDDEKSLHKSLATTLELTPDAPEVTIVQAAHEGSSKVAKQPGSVRLELDGPAPHVVVNGGAGDASALFHAVEDTARQELDRAKRLHAVEPKIEALAKQESDLESHVKADFSRYGDTKANEVSGELNATRDVLAKLKARAQAEARESEDFVADLGRALETASEDKVARAEARRARGEKRKHEDAGASSAKASAQSSDAPTPKPKAADTSPPKAADTGEVFTP